MSLTLWQNLGLTVAGVPQPLGCSRVRGLTFLRRCFAVQNFNKFLPSDDPSSLRGVFAFIQPELEKKETRLRSVNSRAACCVGFGEIVKPTSRFASIFLRCLQLLRLHAPL